MADAREHGPTGHAPIDPAHAAGDPRAIKIDMGQGPPPAPKRPAPPASRGGAGVVLSAVLALLFGGAGAWAYERFVAPRLAAEAPPAAAASQGGAPQTRKEVAGLEDRIKDLSDRCNDLAGQYKQLQSRVESVSRSAPAPDFGPIEQKVAQIDGLSQRVEAIGKKVDPLPGQIQQSERRIAELGGKLDDLRSQEAAASARTPQGRDRRVSLTGADRPGAAGVEGRPTPGGEAESQPAASDEKAKDEPAEPGLESGEGLFRQKRYGEAYATFRKQLQSRPDDARLWYYAALAYGLATGDWDRMAQTMAEQGVAREKAGKPARPEIDAAFSGLTTETGKDWLAFYRRGAR